MRRRLQSYLQRVFDFALDELLEEVEVQSGFDVGNAYVMRNFLESAPIFDVLDFITHAYGSMALPQAMAWRDFVESVFRDEHVAYTVDSECGVHPYVDQEFQRNKQSALAVLSAPHFASVEAALSDAFRHMDGPEPETKAAIRSIFEAVEVMAKLIVPSAARLNKNLALQQLPQACLKGYVGGATEKKVLEGLFVGLAHWADALQDFRHGQADATPSKPSETLAVYAVSSGCAHLRWLAPFAPA